MLFLALAAPCAQAKPTKRLSVSTMTRHAHPDLNQQLAVVASHGPGPAASPPPQATRSACLSETCRRGILSAQGQGAAHHQMNIPIATANRTPHWSPYHLGEYHGQWQVADGVSLAAVDELKWGEEHRETIVALSATLPGGSSVTFSSPTGELHLHVDFSLPVDW